MKKHSMPMTTHHAPTEYGPHVDMRAKNPQYRLNDPGVGLRHNGRRVLTYADLRNLHTTPNRNWAAISLKGLAPYFFEVDTSLFIGQSGHTAARLNAEYEILFTQRLILSPEIEMNFYGKDDPELGIESGLSDISTGLRLRYEIRREFAPYIGINWLKQYMTDGDIQDTQLVIGVRTWF